MKLILSAIAGLLALSGAGLHSYDGQEPLDMATTGSIDRGATAPGAAGRYRLLVAGQDTGCAIERARVSTQGDARIKVDDDCAAAYGPLAQAERWQETDDQTVALADAEGRPLLHLAAGDGVAYETFRPDEPLITLVAR